MNNYEICLTALQLLRVAAENGTAKLGICHEVEEYIELTLHLDPDEPCLLMHDVMLRWPGSSGNESYPVPSPIPQLSARDAFIELSRWEGAYGELRKELLAFLINHFEARVGMNK